LRYPAKVKSAASTSALIEFIDIAPTVLEYCGVRIPETIQGKSLLPLLERKTDRHRGEIFVEYSENEEAAIRTKRWKLVYTTGNRERLDGYKTGRALPGRTIRLFDLEVDPDEMTNVAGRPENAPRVAEFTQKLADHLRRTARRQEQIPQSGDVLEQIDGLLKPDDVPAPAR